MSKKFRNLQNNSDSQNPSSDDRRVGMVVQSSFEGPLPPPEILRRFDEVVPGAAERIIRMAEEQFAHRTTLEKKVIDSDISRSKWGQILGFMIAVVGLGVSALVTIYGNQWAGAVIGGGTLASLVGVFMYGARTRNKERVQKNTNSRN